MITGKIKTINELKNNFVKNCPKSYDATSRILIIDGDSILHTSTYFPEDSEIVFNNLFDKIEEIHFRINTKLQEIQNNVEEYYNIKKTLIFVKGKNNFRYKVFSNYKANRTKQVNELLPYAYEYIIKMYNAIPSHGGEADDYVYDAMLQSKGYCVISSIDKDVLYNCPDVPYYDYRSHDEIEGEFKTMSLLESRYNMACQNIIGDSTDGIKACVGLGIAYCLKNLTLEMTDYQFIKVIFIAYIKSTKGNIKEAKKQMKMNYKLLKLHSLEELKQYE